MQHRYFTTIRAVMPAADWLAVYACEEPPFYITSRLHCLIAGRTGDGYDARTNMFKDSDMDDLAFMEMDSTGVFEDPTSMSNCLAICHERDVTEDLKASWSKQGKAYYEKQRKAA